MRLLGDWGYDCLYCIVSTFKAQLSEVDGEGFNQSLRTLAWPDVGADVIARAMTWRPTFPGDQRMSFVVE
jgi:hypothetical protein